jgi:hypothetical protein
MYRRVMPLILMLVLAGCAASTPLPEPQTAAPDTDSSQIINEPVELGTFVTQINNPYMPLSPGLAYIYEGTIDGAQHRIEIFVTNETRTVMEVECTVVQETHSTNSLSNEVTRSCFAQDIEGTVWKLAEEGLWEAGVDGVQPGIAMPAFPTVGDTYHQANVAGIAEDQAEVLSTTEAFESVFGAFQNAVKIKQWSPLEAGHVEHRYYAAGIGFVLMIMAEGGEGRIELTEIKPPAP